jgi:hypothetical protein
LRSQGRVRILMLQFTSLDECLSFSDLFVRLNPRHDFVTMTTEATGLVAVTPTVSTAISPPPQKEQKTSSQDHFGCQPSNPGQYVRNTPVTTALVPATASMPPTLAAADLETDQRAINGMIVRLLHDRGFLHFVHKIEQYVLNTEDGSKMLQGLQSRELSQA